MAAITFSFRAAIPTLMEEGDKMHNWFKLVPTYNIGSAMYCDRQCQALSDIRDSPFAEGDKLPADKWAFQNITIDTLMMLFHFVFWWIVMIRVRNLQ